jgi:hypothetical protein
MLLFFCTSFVAALTCAVCQLDLAILVNCAVLDCVNVIIVVIVLIIIVIIAPQVITRVVTILLQEQ